MPGSTNRVLARAHLQLQLKSTSKIHSTDPSLHSHRFPPCFSQIVMVVPCVERCVGSGARVPFPSRVAARVEGGLGPRGTRGEGGERGRIRVALPAIDSQGIGRQGFGALGGTPSLVGAAIDRVRGTRTEPVGAPTVRSTDDSSRSENDTDLLPIRILLMPQPEGSLARTVSTTHALPKLRSDSKSTRRSLCRPGSSLQTRRSRRCASLGSRRSGRARGPERKRLGGLSPARAAFVGATATTFAQTAPRAWGA